MATAKKLPSGSWRCQVFSHYEPVFDRDGRVVINPKNGKPKQRRIYESFTSDNPTRSGKAEAELKAAEFKANRNRPGVQKRSKLCEMTLAEAIDKYIESRKSIGRSVTTIQEYESTKKNGFQDLMQLKIKEMDEIILQEAVDVEAKRSNNLPGRKKPISAKRLRNEWGLVRATIGKYRKDIDFGEIELPKTTPRIIELPPARKVLEIIKGSDIELAVLLAIWLSFSMSEVRGLTKSKSLSADGNYLIVREVVVDVKGKPYRKQTAKNETRNRKHRIPEYIKVLIDQVEGDILVPFLGNTLYRKWIRLQDKNNMEHITFHDLRHLNASVMALLRIPDKYAQERGGWKSDKVMKKIYMQTFPEERVRVDDTIDSYFNDLMQHEMQHENGNPS